MHLIHIVPSWIHPLTQWRGLSLSEKLGAMKSGGQTPLWAWSLKQGHPRQTAHSWDTNQICIYPLMSGQLPVEMGTGWLGSAQSGALPGKNNPGGNQWLVSGPASQWWVRDGAAQQLHVKLSMGWSTHVCTAASCEPDKELKHTSFPWSRKSDSKYQIQWYLG